MPGLNFDVQPGTKVAVCVGNSGDVDPLFYAFTRICELSKGTIEIDGVDISKVDLQTLRSSVTMIYDQPAIFEGTLKFNLDPTGLIPDKEIASLLLEAGLNDLLKRSPSTAKEVKPDGNETV